ncbi:hypothetical protein WJX81_004562 [Elliptochloris bilobata]|uniref:TLC domain-containing protein n=1 Tax=Elliptochloris bilobata TaxID=381761 RepID=A0AAW1QKH2_9CHLO
MGYINGAASDPLRLLDSLQSGYLLAIAVAVVLPAIRLALDRAVLSPVGRWALIPPYKKSDEQPTKEELNRLHKWKESAWKALVYCGLVALELYVCVNERFFSDTRYFWLGCTRFPPCTYPVSRGLRLLYSLQMGFYLQAVPSLVFWEVRRKDFWESMAHHFATLGLIVYSYQVNFVKIGAMVFLCHDINDIFLEAAKMARYAQQKHAPNVLFVAFMLSWFASRIFYFPVYLIRSVYYEPIELVAKVYNINPHPHWEIFLALLCFLFALHLYWSYLILKVIVKQIRNGTPDDVREDDD